MSIHDRDYVLRMIRRMVEMLGRALGLPGARPEEAKKTLDETGQTLFGPLYRDLLNLDTNSILSMVGDPDKRFALAVLFFEEGKLSESLGAPKRAQRFFRTTTEILLHLSAEPAGLVQDAFETLRAVAPKVDATKLTESQRVQLRALLAMSTEGPGGESAG